MSSVEASAPDSGRYLTTKDVMKITGASRNIIEWFIRNNISTPYQSTGSAAMLWSPDDLKHLIDAITLRDGGVERKQLIETMQKSQSVIDDALYHQGIDNYRDTRRNIKRMALRATYQSQMDAAGLRDGFYLRYLPERWVATAPDTPPPAGLPWSRDFIDAYKNIHSISDIVGWCLSTECGILTSRRIKDPKYCKAWAYGALANPPMPASTGDMVIDGGCYHVIDPHQENENCDTARCYECSRFGREPGSSERATWKEAEAEYPHLWDDVLMVHDMDNPYPYGPWAGYTARALGHESEDRRDYHGSPKRSERRISMRLQRMPHEVKLPYGVSAAMLPAGIYLCLQCDRDQQEAAMLQLSTFVGIAPKLELTEAMEAKNMEETPGKTGFGPKPQKGPYVEPFARTRVFGDRDMMGWVRDFEDSDLGSIKVLTGTALLPNDDYSIVCCAYPRSTFGKNAPETRYEMQVLVDASELVAEEGIPSKGQKEPEPSGSGNGPKATAKSPKKLKRHAKTTQR